MSFDFAKVLTDLGDDLIAKTGEPLGLSKDQSVRVAQAVGRHFAKGQVEAVKLAAADTGLSEDVVSAMTSKLIDTGKEKLLKDGQVGDAIDSAKAQAQAALANAGGDIAKSAGGMFGKLFGRG